ncbi:MerR family transcriptional regulator [Micromonospora chokoriensis]
MRIGELAAATGVSTRALRYYEEQGLLAPSRSASGQRHYSADAPRRVDWIQALYAAGLSSKVIVGLLPCVHSGVVTPDMVTRLADERDRVEAQIRGLSETRDRLNHILNAAHLLGTETGAM